MKSLLSLITSSIIICIVTACNIYAPFNSNNSDLDKLEEAQKCLKDSDYSCAIEQYNGIKDTNLKNEKLCLVYLTKGGLTLNILINTLNQNSATMLSSLARALVPWSVLKGSDFDSAQTHCESLGSDSSSQGIFLKAVGAFSHCAIRMAKADIIRSTSDSDCNITGNSDGNLTSTDIIQNGTGAIGDGNAGMCKVDVDTCRNDLSSLVVSELSNAGYSELAGAISLLPAGVLSADTNVVRAALKGTF